MERTKDCIFFRFLAEILLGVESARRRNFRSGFDEDLKPALCSTKYSARRWWAECFLRSVMPFRRTGREAGICSFKRKLPHKNTFADRQQTAVFRI